MSTNIDKSLGEIISSRKTTRGGGARRTRRGAARAPVGGIAKNVAKPRTTATRPAAAAAAAAIAPIKGNKKIMVSGLVSRHSRRFSGATNQLILFSLPM